MQEGEICPVHYGRRGHFRHIPDYMEQDSEITLMEEEEDLEDEEEDDEGAYALSGAGPSRWTLPSAGSRYAPGGLSHIGVVGCPHQGYSFDGEALNRRIQQLDEEDRELGWDDDDDESRDPLLSGFTV
jgi:hypothetical protein